MIVGDVDDGEVGDGSILRMHGEGSCGRLLAQTRPWPRFTSAAVVSQLKPTFLLTLLTFLLTLLAS